MSVPAAYLGIILIWSTTPLAVQWSTQGAGFAFAVLARMAIGAVLAGILITVWRIGLPLHARARQSYLAGGLGIFGAMSLTYWGARHIHSGLISVLFGLTPLMTSVLAALWLRERALSPLRIAGMALGIAGLATIFAHGEGAGDAQADAGLAALVLAVFFYSASLVWIKRIGDDTHALATTAGTLAVSLPFFAVVWWFAEGSVPTDLPLRTEAAIVYLGVFGSVLGFALYYYVVRHLEAGRVALITLITPVLALLLGQVLNGEDVGPRVWLGAALITFGLLLHQWSTLIAAAKRAD
ncbi:MAG: DMT family transporter [Gammaproteobacteria bacterium]|nr:DMT family transporter [Gammaproteobacteria bacterium]MBU1416178.1 DMT family transporter [Gammaproteobacteria bacterium]